MAHSEAAYLNNVDKYLEGSRKSAETILPLVFERIKPRSVLDVGCSTGVWLSVCARLGADDITGIDGDYVDRSRLLIPADRFLGRDLASPFDAGRRFDLVMSLEVAEHIPERAASEFVGSLVRHGDTILFSAAIPFQGGTGHVNERWQSYWQDLFAQRGYVAVDWIRPIVWESTDVETWYKQNVLMFCSSKRPEILDALRNGAVPGTRAPFDIVHPKYWLGAADPRRIDPKIVPLDIAMAAVRHGVARRVTSYVRWRLGRLRGRT